MARPRDETGSDRRALEGVSPRAPAGPTPFQRLARPHALMAAGDAVMFVALAGSLFLSIDLSTARTKVLLFLAISVAPFAIVAPLIGPVIDRMVGGRKLVVQAVAGCRVVLALLMMAHIDSVLLFPEVFAALVLGKTYAVSKSALIPSVVANDQELVEASSKLGIIAGVVGAVAIVPAALLQKVSPSATLLFDALLFAAALWFARSLPREAVATHKAGVEERTELRSTVIVLAASAMAFLRACAGFLFFQLAFWLRGQSSGTFWFALSLALAAVGTLLGNVIGPRLRQALREEMMLVLALGTTAVGGLVAAFFGGEVAGAMLCFIVNMAGTIGKLGFDSLVQRNAPDANQGRAFAQFESKFQLAWVLAGIPPVLLTLPGWLGFAVVGALATFALGMYLVSMRSVRLGRPIPKGMIGRARQQVRRRVQRRRNRHGTGAAGAPAAPRQPDGFAPPDPGTRRP